MIAGCLVKTIITHVTSTGNTEFGDYLLKEDSRSSYQFYKLALQALEHRAVMRGAKPSEHFVLKCPEHLWFLDALLDTFPDACIVWTHRDPVASVASYSSLASLNYRMIYGHIDSERVGRHTQMRFKQGVQRAMEVRKRVGEAQFFDVGFKELVGDPMKVVQNIRKHFNISVAAGEDDLVCYQPQGSVDVVTVCTPLFRL